MTRVKFKDLPKDMKITDDEMKLVKGGWFSARTFGSMYSPTTSSLTSPTKGLLDSRADRMKSFSKVDRFVLPNMMHDAGP